MNLLIVRHAHAEPLVGEGKTDADRQLTDKGREQCRLLAVTLHRIGVDLGTIVVSPLVRAKQTADELLNAWPGDRPELQTCEGLAPEGKIRKLARCLRSLSQKQATLIGHMPDLARFCGWMIGDKKSKIHLAKAGAAYIESPVGPGRGYGTLVWLITPAWFDAV
jgi:phosphohistidine phosphatase